MNARVYLSVALMFATAFSRAATTEEASILGLATDAWRKGQSETALTLIAPALAETTRQSRELHELYQNIEVYHERGDALVRKYQQRLKEDRSLLACPYHF